MIKLEIREKLRELLIIRSQLTQDSIEETLIFLLENEIKSKTAASFLGDGYYGLVLAMAIDIKEDYQEE